jgi:hypothetical protein
VGAASVRGRRQAPGPRSQIDGGDDLISAPYRRGGDREMRELCISHGEHRVLLLCGILVGVMTAMGHKRTSKNVRVESALPDKRTSIEAAGMSALCHKRAFRAR